MHYELNLIHEVIEEDVQHWTALHLLVRFRRKIDLHLIHHLQHLQQVMFPCGLIILASFLVRLRKNLDLNIPYADNSDILLELHAIVDERVIRKVVTAPVTKELGK